ncbi:fungal-specific transcription factor domain-containing protein [Aspergillus karnatakaensis]|uniref:transcription factor domain-containing protein n=1 Tax=Aspergillus karnatakaensis TaxID=1810916 RepID=UPI003CCE0A2B
MSSDTEPDHDSAPNNIENGKPRVTRSRVACDWCHSHHARCDRVFPCSRCLRHGTRCEVTRKRRKRGRPREDGFPKIDEFAEINGFSTTDALSLNSLPTPPSTVSSVHLPESAGDYPFRLDMTGLSPRIEDLPPLDHIPWPIQKHHTQGDSPEDFLLTQSIPSSLDDLPPLADLGDASFPLDLLDLDHFIEHNAFTPPDSEIESTPTHSATESSLRYRVLQPLMPFIEHMIPPGVACGLLDLYFTSAYPTHMHPICQHVHCYVLRKASLIQNDHRVCSPALLASILWVASADDIALSLPIYALGRKNIRRFLCSLTLDLLKAQTHKPFGPQVKTSLSETLYPSSADNLEKSGHPRSTGASNAPDLELATGSLDDIITYIHIASIISTSEHKNISTRWWYAAFTMARELNLNREIEIPRATDNQDGPLAFGGNPGSTPGQPLDCVCSEQYGSACHITEQQREERRRIWWLLYMMDRHLALYHNRPLMLLDSESIDLLLPLDENSWQNGELHSNISASNGPRCWMSGRDNERRAFPDVPFSGPSIFGFYLPLMVIMGQLIDLYEIRNHPFLGPGVCKKETWATQLQGVYRQLLKYEASLNVFCANTLPASTLSPSANSSTISQEYSWVIQTAAAYASYYIHLFRILLNGKWDPVSLTEDRYLWASSPSLTFAIPHALRAANSVRQILKFDPDVRFMPDFFGVHLLQGSFRFLFIVESLKDQAGEPFLSAYEAMLRALESCFVTLGTECQRSFCQVMRSAVAQARGRPVNYCDVQRRHRATLALYRSTNANSGLVL